MQEPYLNASFNHSDLWAMAINGDHQAYGSLHAILFPVLHSYILKMVKDEAVADDILQDLFIKLWQNRVNIGPINHVKSYFFTTARSITFNYFRLKKFRNDRLGKNLESEIPLSPEDILLNAEHDQALKYTMVKALNVLPARQKEILHLKYYEEMDYRKIAQITGIQYQSVINHVFRALQLLRLSFKLSEEDIFLN
ncbi:RNA polymerase sigma factor [Mucilaginibacter sp. X5P1]|uniref:RNA polymerase sigma factor n=1 Tax=Mucilaginibacter sp. X5P1 TaxID=2723088 RepID=UPI00160C6267|nr:sigma-70 family RNA polymerase sigma factor [Mucilaginibacter sp. X5P1]MBB6141949.1 RNA polymerase sigma-70 factor (ECF subfamily) [Mucilaginibacter sp. X5P1]